MFFSKATPEQIEGRRLVNVYKSLILHKELILKSGSASQLESVNAVIDTLINQFPKEARTAIKNHIW